MLGWGGEVGSTGRAGVWGRGPLLRKMNFSLEMAYTILANSERYLYTLNAVSCPYVPTYVRNAGRDQLSISELRHN